MPYAIGLQSAATAFASAGFATQFTVAVITFLSIISITSAFQKDAPDVPVSLPGLSLCHIGPFYRRRFDFLNWAVHATGQSISKFKLLRNTVIVVSGESGRQAFFSAKGLDLTEGFKILSGAIPNVRGVTTDLQSRRIATIHKRIVAAQREGHLSTLLPYLLEDSRRMMESWGTSGKFDPFKSIYELTFQTTMRALSCAEIADDHALVSRIKKLYDNLDGSTTPASILMPWLPSWTMLSKLWSTKEIYFIIVEAVKQRQELLSRLGEGAKPQDTMQLLLDAGDDRMAVVGFIMGLLIAGARATGTSASWLVTFLASHPEWAMKARAEVEDLVATHTDVRFNSMSIPTPSWLHSGPKSDLSPASLDTRFGNEQNSDTPRGSQKFSLCPTWPPTHSTATMTSIVTALPQTSSQITPSPTTATSATCTSTSPHAPVSSTSSSPLPHLNCIPLPTIPTAWSSRSRSIHTYSSTQTRDSQSSTLPNKRKRCNSGSDLDADSADGSLGWETPKRSSQWRQMSDKSQSAVRKNEETVEFPDSDGEQERVEEGRAFGGPNSLLGDLLGQRRRKDAITVPPPVLQPGTREVQDLFPPRQCPHGPASTSVPVQIPSSSAPQDASISKTLSRIPLESWESSTPILDALIKETLRIAQPHTAMRRNMGPETYIDGKLVENGAYVIYPFSDVHLDESIYEKAGVWLPGRWLADGGCSEGVKMDPTKGVPYGYIGWGAGKSMCLGTRLAKIELKLVISMFVLGYNLDVVDKKGMPMPVEDLPNPNWNDILLCRPEKEFYVGFERREKVDL